MTKLISIIILIFFSFHCKSQTRKDVPFKYDPITKEYKVIINKQILKKYSIDKNYPAVTLSLRQNNFIYPNEEAKKLDEIDANTDLWIEPRDPEINAFPEESSKLKLINQEWNFKYSINSNTIVFNEDSVERKNIKQGTIFLIKTIEGTIFKVRIDSFNKEKEEITLTYKLIE